MESRLTSDTPAQGRVDSLADSAVDYGENDPVTAVILSAPENALDPTVRTVSTGLATKIEPALIGTLLAAFYWVYYSIYGDKNYSSLMLW